MNGRSSGWWIGRSSFTDERTVTSAPEREFCRTRYGIMVFMLGNSLLHVEKELVKCSGPGLMKDLINESQFPKDMAVTQAVLTTEFEIGRPAIVNKSALINGQDAEGGNGFPPSFGMEAIPGDQSCAEDMEPMEFMVHPNTGFIDVDDRGLLDVPGYGVFERGEGQFGGLNSGLDGGVAYAVPEEIGAHLADALHWQELLDREISEPGQEMHAILHGGVHAFWPWSMNLFTRAWAYFNLDNVLGNVEFLRWQVEDLSSLMADDRRVT